MRHRALPEALFALAVLCGACALTGCHAPAGSGAESVAQGEEAALPPAGAGAGAGHSPTFLGRGSCTGRGRPAYEEVDCASERAAASVLARHYGPQAGGPRCPEATDFVLHITAVNTGTSESESAPEGYACMRNLRPPHPGDPGRGGGPLTVAGDCVYTERRGVVKETACEGAPGPAPEFRVEETVSAREDCPPETDLYVQVGGGAPVGCARRLP